MLKKRTLALLLSLTMLLSLLTPTALATEGEEPGTTQEEVVKSNENEQTDQPGETENGDAKDENQDPQQPTTGDEEQPTGQDEPKNEDETKGEDGQPGEEPKQPEQTGDDQPTEPEQGEETETPEDPQEPETDYESMSAEDLSALLDSLTEEEALAILDNLSAEKYDELVAYWDSLVEEDPVGESVSFTDVGPLLDQDEDQMIPGILKAALLGGIGTCSDDQDNGVRLSKSVKAVDGGYQITLEAYATGSSTTVVSTNPVDIVLVLDVSGSMDDPITEYKPVYNLDRNNDYYIQRDGKYTKVSYNRDEGGWGYYSSSGRYWTWNAFTPKTSANDGNASHVQFYEVQSGEDKIVALKEAVNGFIDNVSTTSPNSSIAIVKFSGKKPTPENKTGNDTYTDRRYTYNYSQIVKNLTEVKDNENKLKTAVDALKPAGATRADHGMELAKNIIDGVANDKRKKVVIMFTDGKPTSFSNFDTDVADAAISASKGIKDAGATVYTIGVLGEANGTPIPEDELKQLSNTDFNKYMHLVSSNYKNATSMSVTGSATYPEGGKSYYLSAVSSSDLSNIFTQISQEVGGSTVKLDKDSYILDTVTDQFKIPTGTDVVKFYTEDCIGKDPTSGKETFDEKTKVEAPDVTYEIKDNTLKVTNFDFSANWCGPRDGKYSGKKLIVEFTVTERDGFLGGNDVTNVGETDGVYDKAGNRYGEFDPPTVNVPIEDVTVGAEDKNIYVMGGVTVDELRKGTTIKVGDVELKLGETNYGLADWQTDGVKITTSITDEDGNEITSDLTGLMDDKTYTVTVKVEPKVTTPVSTEGVKAVEKGKAATANINVFKPEITWKDSAIELGETANYEKDNFVSVVWKHWDAEGTETLDTDVIMTGEKPIGLDYTYNPPANKFREDTPVKVTKVTATFTDKSTVDIPLTKVKFVHADCGFNGCKWGQDGFKDCQFIVHIKPFDLTITKSGWDTIDENQAFVFHVTGTDVDMYVTINFPGKGEVTIKDLKPGTYKITEESG